MIALPPEHAAGMFYNDLEPEESKRLTALLKPHSAAWVQFRRTQNDSHRF